MIGSNASSLMSLLLLLAMAAPRLVELAIEKFVAYHIVKAIIAKTDPEDLAQVLAVTLPLLNMRTPDRISPIPKNPPLPEQRSSGHTDISGSGPMESAQ